MASSLPNTLSLWIAECMMNHTPEQTIIELLVQQGHSKSQIEQWIQEVKTNPYIAIGQKVATQKHQLEWLLHIFEQTRQYSQFHQHIERRSNLSGEEFLERYVTTSRPVIITDLLDDWPAKDKWTPYYLKENYGQHTVEILKRQDDDSYAHESLLFQDYVDMVNSTEYSHDFYMTGYNTPKHHGLIEALLQDIIVPSQYCKPDAIEAGDISLWYGPAGTVTRLHMDIANGLLTQVQGRKSVKMIPPYYLPNLYLEKDLFSPVSLNSPNFDRYPLAQYIEPMEFTLEPGDALFIPITWWHQIKALEPSMSVSFINFKFPNQYQKLSQVFPTTG